MNRYPILKTWIPMMQERIAEYQIKKAPYNSDIYQSDTYPGFTSATGKRYNLNEYLSASRDNYFGNNVLINTNDISAGQSGRIEGYVNTGYEKNLLLTAQESPFTGENYGDSSAYEKIKALNPDFEPIPFERIGLTTSKTTKNEKAVAVKPANTTINPIPTEGLTLEWKYVIGAQRYKVELSDREDFSNIIDSKTTVEYYYPVEAELEKDKVYYWRVTTIPEALCSEGGEMISDTFTFKTSAKESLFNTSGVTDCTYTESDGKVNLSVYGYNLTDSDQTFDMYVACYDDEGKMLDLDFEEVSVATQEFSEKTDFRLNTSDFSTIKIFVWVENSLYPTTFARKITK